MKCVFFSASGSIVRWAYNDIIQDPSIEYCDFAYDAKRGLNRFIYSRKVGKILPYFIKDTIYPKALGYKFFKEISKDEVVLFFFTCQYNMFFDPFFETFIQFLKKKYRNSKYVFYYNDIIKTCYPESLDMIKKEFDLVLTFDQVDADTYGLTYYGEVYSSCQVEEDESTEESDLFYVGSDRGRFDNIVNLFIRTADFGLKSVFYIFDLHDESKNRLHLMFENIDAEKQKIHYKNSILKYNTYCPYPKTLSYINKTKCLVEILLTDQTGGSLRMAEAVTYGKKLLTNCHYVKNKPYYYKENIKIFDSVEDIDKKELCDFINSPGIDVKYDFSPLKMIQYAADKLNNSYGDT